MTAKEIYEKMLPLIKDQFGYYLEFYEEGEGSFKRSMIREGFITNHREENGKYFLGDGFPNSDFEVRDDDARFGVMKFRPITETK